MADLPIIFSAAMVRALLDGRKTMTRRLVKPQPEPFAIDDKGALCEVALEHIEGDPRPRIRLGRVITLQEIRLAAGDRLWVREAFMPRPMLGKIAKPHYRADPDSDRPEWRGLWKPSIHMPRWASRLTLIVTGTKIERLQDISPDDAVSEGLWYCESGDAAGFWFVDPTMNGPCGDGAVECFAELWRRLHGPKSWDANPYVVAPTFTVHKTNIDAPPKAGPS